MKRLFNLCSAALALLLCLGALPARAANYVVSNLNDSGAGSLRDAIEQASSTPDDDTITFTVSGTVALVRQLNWNSSQGPAGSIDGGSLVIDGTGRSITITSRSGSRVISSFTTGAEGRTLTLKGLTVADNKSGVRSLIAILFGNLQLVNCVFSGNVSSDDLVFAAAGRFEVDNTLFSGNSSTTGSVISALGEGSNLTITNSRFTENTNFRRTLGSAVIANGTVTIINSSFESNRGSGPAVRIGLPTSRLAVLSSSFVGNVNTETSSVFGSAIDTLGSTTITNSTFHTNSGFSGALIASSGGRVVVNNSTFSGNRATSRDGIVSMKGGTVTLRNTIIANSTGGNCGAGVLDGGGNLSDDMSCNFTAASSLNGTDAQLGLLADNGGPTKTMMPLTGSPAIDQGVNALALDAAGVALTTDQRGSGFPRIIPTGGTVDRGAVEAPAAPPPVLNTCPAATAQVGVAYSSALGATGGTVSNRFSITGNLPPTLALNPTTGALTGVLTKPGSYAFTATVADLASPTPRSSSRACSITVAEAANVGPLIVTPTRLAFGAAGSPGTLMKLVVTLKNIGPPVLPGVKSGWVPVTLGPVSVTPDAGTPDGAFTVVNACPASLNVGQSCTITVATTAGPGGPRTATLNIPNNAPASPQTVALSAGAAP